MPFCIALGALIIKDRLGLTDDEAVTQFMENHYLQFFIGLEGFQFLVPFDPLMIVYFRKRLPESVVNDCSERIVRYGLNMIRSSASTQYGVDSIHEGGLARSDDQQIRSDKTRHNQGSLLIDAECIPAAIRYPSDVSLLNEARELTETLFDAMHSKVRDCFGNNHRPHRKQA